MISNDPHKKISLLQYRSGKWSLSDSKVNVEFPVTITVNGDAWVTLMCTPIELEFLAVGFLFNEGYINSMDDIASMRVCTSGDNVDIWLNQRVERPENWLRTSGCTGGKTSIEMNDFQTSLTGKKQFMSILSPDQIFRLTHQLLQSQDLYQKAGGTHISLMTDGEGTIISAEDIGRHNTLDKIAGKYLLSNKKIDPRIVVTTGRISSEMLQKSSRLDASIIISRTSPSSLSIEMGKESGITIIGYARRNQFKVFTYPERITISNRSFLNMVSSDKDMN